MKFNKRDTRNRVLLNPSLDVKNAPLELKYFFYLSGNVGLVLLVLLYSNICSDIFFNNKMISDEDTLFFEKYLFSKKQ